MPHPKQKHDWKCTNLSCKRKGKTLTPDDFYFNGVKGRYNRHCKRCVSDRMRSLQRLDQGTEGVEGVIRYLGSINIKNRAHSLFSMIKQEKISRGDFGVIIGRVKFK